MFDFNKIGLLLHILDKSRQWPQLKPTHDAALSELTKIQDDAKEQPVEAKAPPEDQPGSVPPIERKLP